ncbi:type II 3-dehydroquinate dehydratase [Blastococcus sp. TF02A-35]|uniref:type II 3-dehydroquinate dehydratase n=1 Tax=Blastococcus sp. TF02A-35 TaxID=2559612 RepID=UPI00107364AE|nr:type II 3-dehydroquinate dehydratase [Blastococcus sp. TF02A_35]TFV50407.1 type II 3-dehydroquinate dehydratase [Blastococcus sp. TF02A_35]
MTVLVLNGPNLGRLGTREPEIYGSTTYAQLVELLERAGAELEMEVQVRQTDDEAEMLRWVHAATDAGSPIVLNPASWSHTSIALHDALAATTAPVVEVHISNIHKREQFRHHSYVSAVADGVIAGLGIEGYVLALQWLSLRGAR